MKRIILSLVCVLFSMSIFAQSFIVINSEKVFKSIPVYNAAVDSLDKLATSYKDNVDKAYAKLEQMYSDFENQAQNMSQTAAQRRQTELSNWEKEISKSQEDIFGQNGTLFKKRVEMLKPIQEKVFKIISQYATSNKIDLVLDIATNPSILYYNPTQEKTSDIIKLVGDVK